MSSGQNPNLYTVSLDDLSQPIPLFTEASLDVEPVWSPDGHHIAFASLSTDGKGFDIYLIDADGTNFRQVTFMEGHEREPVWSPNGQYLAFVYSELNKEIEKLAILHVDQFGDPEQQPLLLEHESSVRSPSWSIDGELVGFVSEHGLSVADMQGNVSSVSYEQFDSWASDKELNVWFMDWQFSYVGMTVNDEAP